MLMVHRIAVFVKRCYSNVVGICNLPMQRRHGKQKSFRSMVTNAPQIIVLIRRFEHVMDVILTLGAHGGSDIGSVHFISNSHPPNRQLLTRVPILEY